MCEFLVRVTLGEILSVSGQFAGIAYGIAYVYASLPQVSLNVLFLCSQSKDITRHRRAQGPAS